MGRTMPKTKNIVVKDNALINASYNLELIEQRLILLAVAHSRRSEQTLTAATKITIGVSDYIDTYSTQGRGVYDNIKRACKALFERQFTYAERRGRGVRVATSRWVSEIAYNDDIASIDITFAPAVVPLLCELERNFTSYALEQVAELSSKYAVRLYEIIIAWRAASKMPIIAVDELRGRLGVADNEYIRMSDFKKRVLDYAIAEINEHTDIIASYEQHKQGRKVTGFTFAFERKVSQSSAQITAQQTKQTTNINLNNLTDQEHDIIAQKNAYADSIGATAEHRQNLIKQALKQHQDAIQAEQEAKQRKKAERQAQKAREKQQLELARKQYEQILASDTLINAYIANNINPQKMRASLQKMRYEQGDFRGVFELEKHKFEKLSYLKSLNLKFLDKINS